MVAWEDVDGDGVVGTLHFDPLLASSLLRVPAICCPAGCSSYLMMRAFALRRITPITMAGTAKIRNIIRIKVSTTSTKYNCHTDRAKAGDFRCLAPFVAITYSMLATLCPNLSLAGSNSNINSCIRLMFSWYIGFVRMSVRISVNESIVILSTLITRPIPCCSTNAKLWN